jgi:hypothetical protein
MAEISKFANLSYFFCWSNDIYIISDNVCVMYRPGNNSRPTGILVFGQNPTVSAYAIFSFLQKIYPLILGCI